jgi:hypothetical protein
MNIDKAFVFSILICLVTVAVAFDSHFSGDVKPQEALKHIVGNIGSGKADVESVLILALHNARLPGGIVRGPDLDNEIERESISQMTIEGLLNNIVSITHVYRWVVDDGVINLVPALNEPAMLSFIVTQFDADNLVSLDDALNRLLEMPDLQKRSAELHLNTGLEILVGPVRPPGSPRDSFSVHCRNKTLRETLNIMVRSQGRGVWEYRETHWDKHHGFSIRFPIQ